MRYAFEPHFSKVSALLIGGRTGFLRTGGAVEERGGVGVFWTTAGEGRMV